MTCKEFVNSVTDYLDDALASHHRAEFDHHRESCANCQTYFKQMNQLIRAAPFLQEDPGKITVPLRLYELLAEKTRVPSR
ncbi:MAG TPA: zf-HC2 domain-containing protein, partial [Terriglobia bacterium]|nr:zf-HC2 domain-containing protein [Terriglobia bacterium]